MFNKSSHIPHFALSQLLLKFGSSTTIEDDSVFVESFFAIPDKKIESKMHLQSPWLLCLELDCAKMIDRKLTIHYVAGRIPNIHATDLWVWVWTIIRGGR
jgi:DNA-directed RNA polymerase II subunit RPB1